MPTKNITLKSCIRKAIGRGEIGRGGEQVMPGISNIELSPSSFSSRLKCKACKTAFVATTEVLECGGFKADPNTYYFDGSATEVAKFFVACPSCQNQIIVKRKAVPILVQSEVYSRSNDERIDKGWGPLPQL